MKKEPRRIRVTAYGGAVVAVAVLVWVVALLYGHLEPESWLGKLMRLPFGTTIVIFGSAFILVPVEKYFKRRGKPLFVESHDANQRDR